MPWCWQAEATSLYLNQKFLSFLEYVAVVKCGWSDNGWKMLDVNLLWSSDAIWHDKSGSTLAQVMAPSHYQNHGWVTKMGSCGIHLWTVSWEELKMICKMSLKITLIKLLPHLPGANKFNSLWASKSYDIIRQGQNHCFLYLLVACSVPSNY